MTFIEWLRHRRHEGRPVLMPEADRLLLVIQAAGTITRQQLRRSIELPYWLLDDLLDSYTRLGLISMSLVDGQMVIRAGR